MYIYGNNISELSHDIIKHYVNNLSVAVDATLGNGNDTTFLSKLFKKVYAFDIQECAIQNYKDNCPSNVILINDSHEEIDKYINEQIDCIIYNLGYLPGGNKNITTKAESTVSSIKKATRLIRNNGFIILCVYIGHKEGIKEKKFILEYLSTLPKNQYSIIIHQFFNRNNAPLLISIEKCNKIMKD